MRMSELTSAEASAYRTLRLKALQEEASAFGASFEDEVTYPLSVFEEKLNAQNNYTIGAFEGHQLIGIITLKKQLFLKRAHISEIGGMYVHPDFRGQGVSKSIMASAIMRAKELKCEQIHLNVNIENKTAKNVYTSFGFEIIGMEKKIIKLHDGSYIDEYRMALYFAEWTDSSEAN
ncbi:GNAT family N-acetyltransferase [Kurthia sibirica]|uniref:GNAT family N-acetyltransferase n=1 Tax=Kurthia sibirica TaxID=202750 RepID=A0A2U3AKP6_9BACL|nr:GNAT family N-acetyltransferase [Kurthia sibirica]PWI25082.1 GNAT family N-acetyltransferase [Kurthia sibirica]GEK34000.1 N-acetyltransferase [Kurthia sibirica]